MYDVYILKSLKDGKHYVGYSKDLKRRIDYLKNFGIHDEETVLAPGINAKMNEVQAAMGLIELNHVEKEIERGVS